MELARRIIAIFVGLLAVPFMLMTVVSSFIYGALAHLAKWIAE